MKNCPKIFVIILNYKGKDFVKKCLASVFKNEYPNFEAVVVDNNSTDGSFEEAKSNFSKAHFIKNEANLGFSAGNNVGVRFALERMADYILILSSNAEIEKDSIFRLITIGEKEKKAGILSPVIFNCENKQVLFSGGKIKWLALKTENNKKTKITEYYPSEFVSDCAMLVKKEVFKKIGLFDEDFFLYNGGMDFSWRARKAGFENLVVTGSWAYYPDKNEQDERTNAYWLVISNIMFFKKNVFWILKPWITLLLFFKKGKNFLDTIFKKNELTLAARKAYSDYQKYAK